MTIVMGLDQHERRSLRSGWTPRRARCRARGSRRRTAPGCGGSASGSVARSSRSRWRRRPAGGSWPRSSGGSARRCISPSRRRRRRRRGNKQRAKSDRADARHVRELLMIGRLPESWIPPEHILDLRARVRLRHTLSHQRGEWQQRIQAVLYHHGCPQRSNLMTERRPQLARGAAAARRSARAGHDRVERDRCARASARAVGQGAACVCAPPAGCKALMGQFGVGELTAVTILAELGDARAGSPRPGTRSGSPGWTSRCTSPISAERLGISPPRTAGAALGAVRGDDVRRPRVQPRLRVLLRRRRSGSGPTGRDCRSRARSQAQLSPAARTRRGGARSRMTCSVRAKLFVTQMRRGRLHARSCRHVRSWTALIDRAAATLPPAGSPHQPSCRRPRASQGRGPR